MVTHSTLPHRMLLAGGFAAAVVMGPIAGAVFGTSPVSVPLANCPPGQSLDVFTGACHPGNEAPEPVENPINPEGAELQTGAITSAETGEIGRLPEVNGIPCTGDNTGLCIGLTEMNNNLGSGSFGTPENPTLENPYAVGMPDN